MSSLAINTRQVKAKSIFCRAVFLVTISLLLGACTTAPTKPSMAEIGIYSAPQGSGFLPYAQGLAHYLSANGLKAQALETKGSIENMGRLDAEPGGVGAVFLGTAYEGVNGTGGWTKGKKHSNVRALFPMYETSFQIVTLRSSGLTTLRSLSGKRVGVGPAGGPAENFFKGLVAATGVQAKIVTGTPANLVKDLHEGRIDALWQGASVPIPSIKQVTDATDAAVFGLNDDELTAMLKQFPFLSPASVAPNTYRGQTKMFKSVAAWNFIMAHKDMSDADAYWITRTVLSAAKSNDIHSSAGPTLTANAPNNAVVPFHTGALKFYREQGISGLK